jgi:hypothetical protein
MARADETVMHRSSAAFAGLALVLSSTRLARVDVTPPREGCVLSREGDSCDLSDGKKGMRVNGTAEPALSSARHRPTWGPASAARRRLDSRGLDPEHARRIFDACCASQRVMELRPLLSIPLLVLLSGDAGSDPINTREVV